MHGIRYVWLAALLSLGLGLGAQAASAACDCGGDQCTGTSVTYAAPSWSGDPTAVRYDFNCNGGNCTCGQYVTGDYWVVDQNLVVTAISPAATSGCGASGSCRNGFEINPSQRSKISMDDRITDAGFYTPSVHGKLPHSASPGDAIVKSISLPDTSGRSRLRRAVVLSVVASAPSNPKDLFRPPYYGTSEPNREYRLSQIDTSALAFLPSDVASKPSFQDLVARFSLLQLDHIDNYPQRQVHPADNFWWPPKKGYDDYHQDIAIRTAVAPLRFMLNDFSLSNPTHKAALVGFLQYGIDMYWIMSAGKLGGTTGWGSAGSGRKMPVAFAARLFNDSNMKTNLRTSGYYEDVGVTVSSRADGGKGKELWGRSACTEAGYWEQIRFHTGDKRCRDPYGYIDGTFDIPSGYIFCCNAQPAKQASLAVRLLGIEDLWDYDAYLAFADRWVTSGFFTKPDVCAPYDGNPSNYGVTYGPAPGNSSSCHQTQTCNCIKGSGRFVAHHGAKANGGYYGDAFADEMWTRFRATAGSGGGGGGGGTPSLAAPFLLED